MSKSSCPWCNHSNVTAEGRNHYCNYCGHEWQYKPTVFDRITASPEALAETYMFNYDGKEFKSLLLPNMDFNSREAAFNATVARLKEVGDEK